MDFRLWDVIHNKKSMMYIPSDHQLVMHECKLYCNVPDASIIYDSSGEKSPKGKCAWVICDSVEAVPIIDAVPVTPDNVELSFSPVKAPHWMCDGTVVDDGEYPVLFTSGFKVYY